MIWGVGKYITSGLVAWVFWGFSAPLAAQEFVCARVKIEIKEELTLERQAMIFPRNTDLI